MEYQKYELAEINEVTEESAISVMHKRYTMLADILPVVENEQLRSNAIADASVQYGISKQTIRSYLWMYLVAQDKKALAPIMKKIEKRDLTLDEKNMRWALYKFFYSMNKNSLSRAYKMVIQAKYCDGKGKKSSHILLFISLGTTTVRRRNNRIILLAGMVLKSIRGINVLVLVQVLLF